ncbi:polyserase-2-like [Micropterus salmoides]|nr:polyserase-2-like [Micropterus salmoides]
MICAGLNAGGQVSCQGDLGGPLVSKQGGRWIQEGIVTLGNDCTGPNFPALFARVSQYQSWINSQITSNQPGFLTFMSNGTDSDLSFTCPVPPPTTTAPPVVCGQAPLNSRILGGSSVATAGVWPSMASLRNNGSHVCGGTLVALDFVLSDANCFSSSPIASEWTVVLGRLNQNGSNPFEVTLKVTNITLSNFTGSNVAVLRLATRPTLSNHIQPICLDNGQTFTVGSTCWAAGWSAGQGGVLQEVQTSVVNCGNASTSDSICTSSFTLAQGDAGGPMMCKLGGSWFQAAVLSVQNNSTSQTRADPVMVFTKLSRFQTFLAQILGTFLSPASTSSSTAATTTPTTSGGAPAHSPIFFFHLLIFSVCLHVFS